MSAGNPRQGFRMAEPEWRAFMARVQAAYGPAGEVSRVIRKLIAIYRAVPVELERQLRGRAMLEGRPLAEVVVEVLRRGLDESPRTVEVELGDDDAPAEGGEGSKQQDG